ncbi:Ca-activated chloride channel family protein [Granulicella rosea]|uniref:Ca-activated chloride channel family protein n=1 Tax=Granulicella rosea TaxID=474952 RepID=A0A239M504_9BACT|nr:VWA domain-containing protein [Granulicella rosea]SNT37947.1 Ca-activated chloride channel family protein [Granulicella rosea]
MLANMPRLAAALLVFASLSSAQNLPTLKVETHLIDTTVSVHDSSGGLVRDLAKADIAIVEDGIPQTTRFFYRAEQLPLSIGLVIDASGSQEKFVRDHERDIADFLHQSLDPDDRAFALCFGNHLRMVSDWTHDRQAIVENLRRYDKGQRDSPELGPAEEREAGTALNDAVFYSITEKMANIHQRRKVLVVFSDGEENSSEHDLLDAIEAAENNDVIVYAIRYTELNHGRMNARDRYGMRELDHLTAQTGGKAYDVHTMKVSEAFAEIAGELRSLYGVAYQSTNPTRDGSFRKVVIRPVRKGLVIRARAGYYAK